MIKRLVGWFVLIPLCSGLVVFALANRHSVNVQFDPVASFSGQSPFIPSVEVPLFVVIYAMLLFGVTLGGVATWFTQGRQRREKRAWRREARKLEGEKEGAARREQNQINQSGGHSGLFDAS